jgi:hypothetical protein
MLLKSLFNTGNRIPPNPNAETFQSNFPNLRYFMPPLLAFTSNHLESPTAIINKLTLTFTETEVKQGIWSGLLTSSLITGRLARE